MEIIPLLSGSPGAFSTRQEFLISIRDFRAIVFSPRLDEISKVGFVSSPPSRSVHGNRCVTGREP